MYYTSHMDTVRTRQAIAMEAEVLSNMVKSIAKYFPSLFEGFSAISTQLSNLVGFTTKPAEQKELDRRQQALVDAIMPLDYSFLTGTTIPVPEGFVGRPADYARDLQDVLMYYKEISLEATKDFYVTIAAVLTNKDQKISLHDETRKFKALERQREDRNKELMKHFQRSSTMAGQKYGKLFGAHVELAQYFKEVNRLRDALPGYDLDEIRELTHRVVDTLEALINQVESGGDMRITPEVAKNLSDGAYEIAKQIEFFAINYYRAQVLINVTDSVVERLERRLEAG